MTTAQTDLKVAPLPKGYYWVLDSHVGDDSVYIHLRMKHKGWFFTYELTSDCAAISRYSRSEDEMGQEIVDCSRKLYRRVFTPDPDSLKRAEELTRRLADRLGIAEVKVQKDR